MTQCKSYLLYFCCLLFIVVGCEEQPEKTLTLSKNSRISLIGTNMASRMVGYGYFETELQLRYPEDSLFIRNMGDGGNTPGFRAHPGRETPWAFEGAETFYPGELSNKTGSKGHFEYPDQWLTRLKTDVILAFFGYNSAFKGEAGLANYKAELDAFVKHTLAQKYNGNTAPQLALVSPTAFQDLSKTLDVPTGILENSNLKAYAKAMSEVATANNLVYVDAYSESLKWYKEGEALTIDGVQLNDAGNKKLATFLADWTFGKTKAHTENKELVLAAVKEKNWMWHNDFKIPNGVHVYGRRYNPYGPKNYPDELKKIREMTAIRDAAIWNAIKGIKIDVVALDKDTHVLPAVETNYKVSNKNGDPENYLYGKDAEAQVHAAEGYKVALFASEKEFPDLANPVQMSFDNKGRLWVGVMPSYPHYKPGDAKPNDKIIILEDTDNDGKADKQITFLDNIHLPIGFEIAPEGVYVSQGEHLKLFTDTDGDDKADTSEILLSGFDDHDTHHAISAFCADPSGAIYMGEGTFLHTNVETSYKTVRGDNGGFYRYNPARRHLERTANIRIPNPWGIAFDEYGQYFFAETSGPAIRWMMPSTIKHQYGKGSPKSKDLAPEGNKVRPTSGLEFVSSRHFPEEVQGDLLINNSIGFLGMKQHQIVDDSTGYDSTYRQDLMWSDDKNFRPVDMEFAPDGSLYFIDWHNVLIGHMQHNARDPLRDHAHGRVYRITYPGRPLVTPAKIDGESVKVLLENLKLPEYRSRYRTRRELRGRDTSEVLAAVSEWATALDKSSNKYEDYLLEALWVSWGANKVDAAILESCLAAKNYKVRAAAVTVLRYMGHQFENSFELLKKAVVDNHGRVRLAAIVAASWLEAEEANEIFSLAEMQETDSFTKPSLEVSKNYLAGKEKEVKEEKLDTHLKGVDLASYKKGKEIYSREGFCVTCHQDNGKGLSASGFPPISGTKWALGNEDRLIKIALYGLYGPIEVLGKKYPGQVPMTAYGNMLKDDEIAAVLTYVRNSFGNKASVITAEKVKEVRKATAGKEGFYKPEELLKEHPLEK